MDGVPSQEEIYREAEAMAREMYPERFPVISPEHFDQANSFCGVPVKLSEEPLNDYTEPIKAQWPDQTPLSRLFAAVRATLQWYDVDSDGIVSELEPLDRDHSQVNAEAVKELRAAYDDLGMES